MSAASAVSTGTVVLDLHVFQSTHTVHRPLAFVDAPALAVPPSLHAAHARRTACRPLVFIDAPPLAVPAGRAATIDCRGAGIWTHSAAGSAVLGVGASLTFRNCHIFPYSGAMAGTGAMSTDCTGDDIDAASGSVYNVEASSLYLCTAVRCCLPLPTFVHCTVVHCCASGSVHNVEAPSLYLCTAVRCCL